MSTWTWYSNFGKFGTFENSTTRLSGINNTAILNRNNSYWSTTFNNALNYRFPNGRNGFIPSINDFINVVGDNVAAIQKCLEKVSTIFVNGSKYYTSNFYSTTDEYDSENVMASVIAVNTNKNYVFQSNDELTSWNYMAYVYRIRLFQQI